MKAVSTDKGSSGQRRDIIQIILDANYDEFVTALHEDPSTVNSVHSSSGMNAAMLCAIGRMPTFLHHLLTQYGSYLDFGHFDNQDNDLQEVAIRSLSPAIVQIVDAAYAEHAKHIANNWPPSP